MAKSSSTAMAVLPLSLMLLAVIPGSAAAEEPAIRFTNVTAGTEITFVETIGDDKMSNIVESTGVGCGLLDFDLDGWLDIYLISGHWRADLSDSLIDSASRAERSVATDRLYRNRGDGTYEDVTEAAGVARSAFGMGIVVSDYDADGDPDMYITNYGANFLYRNNGDGTFTEVAESAGVAVPGFSTGSAFFDYNGDGWLDLYVGGYITYDPDYKYYYAPDGFPGPMAYTGQQDRLFQGTAEGVFTDVTREAGVEIAPVGRAMGVAAFDYDNDNALDVFVSNDAMENFLLRNSGDGTFENLAWDAGVAFGQAGEATAAMAVEVADFDQDGYLDVFVPDLDFSCLYHNSGGTYFEENSVRSGIAAASGQYDSWGGAFADFDLDGNLDLYVSNGDVHHLEPQEDLLLRGDAEGGFADVSEHSGEWSRRKFVSRGLAKGDLDNDGDIDLLVVNLNDRPTLLRNDSPRRGRHWLSVHLVGTPPNRDAIGARISVTIGKRTMTRQKISGGSYLSQHAPQAHFGIGTHDRVDELTIVWPDGSRNTMRDLPVDRVMTIHQGKVQGE